MEIDLGQSECINELFCLTFALRYKLDCTINHTLQWDLQASLAFNNVPYKQTSKMTTKYYSFFNAKKSPFV